MRIAIQATWTARGGIETFVYQLMKEFSKKHEVFFFVSYWGNKNIYELPKNVHIIEVPVIPQKKDKEKIKNIFLQNKIQIIHINNTDAVSIAILKIGKKLKIPTVISNHQVPEYGVYRWNSINKVPKIQKIKTLIRNFIWKRALVFIDSQTSLVIVPSLFLKNKLISYGVRKKIEVISCGVDTILFSPKPVGVALKNFYKSEKTILYMGRLDFGKRIDVLIRAYFEIAKKYDNVGLVLCGQDSGALSALQELINFLKINDRVSILSSLPAQSQELINYYRYATLFVLPSEMETQGIVVLEAMACGLPIVAANTSALPELVKPRENGFLFKNGDVEDCARYIEIILSDVDQANRFGARGRELIMDHDIEKVAIRFLEVYGSLIQ
ncbi:glycosyltransferase family 1 protein [Candidatus Parcubacteria bacterium]|jgi:glycosyltransferase involved in cell wall biosynthesis|nr:MAG: glycosyltransferase family 1 protein [Candidatus Parcubacteria bacterium]